MRKILTILVVCIITQFIFSSKGVVYGDSISNLEKKVNNLKDQNQKLEIEIATLTSYSRISEKISADGFLQAFSLSTGSNEDKSDFSVALRR